ncbi:MAG: hypothetical protein M3R24_39935 [Chloroflexota bacterium]|nr:hypothetical protein [Chloroflexota bacterium]
MTTIIRKARPLGYPSLVLISRGSDIYELREPPIVHLTCQTQLRDLHRNKEAALIQVFKNVTLAASWILRDIHQRNPLHTFRRFRIPNSTRYNTDKIADTLAKSYRPVIRKRYAINAHVFEGMCVSLAEMLSWWLRMMTDAQRRGHIQRYEESARHVIPFGKHRGQTLGSVGRRVVFGYAFLMPKLSEVQEALRYIEIVLNEYREDKPLFAEAAQYKMTFGRRQGDQLGSMLPETLRRLRALCNQEIARSDETEKLRSAAQQYLQFTPPGFPTVGTDGLSAGRHADLDKAYLESLGAFASLKSAKNTPAFLTEEEHKLFIALQQDAYAATRQAEYMPLRWKRADGCVNGRDVALLYVPKRRRYKLLTYVLASNSRHRQPLKVNEVMYDVNNPGLVLEGTGNPVNALLFDLDFGSEQLHLLDRARASAEAWKDEKRKTGGSVRRVTLHALYNEDRGAWSFQANIVVGFKPSAILKPQHFVGVHVDPDQGLFVSVLTMDGKVREQFHLNEAKIVELLQTPSTYEARPAHRRSSSERDLLVRD